MNEKQVWEKVTDFLKNQMTQESFDLWIRPLLPVSISQEKLIIQAPNKFFSDWIKTYHKNNIEKLVSELTGANNIILEFNHLHDLDSILRTTNTKPQIEEREETPPILENSFNPKYSFENFVEGAANRFAKATCFAAANNPGKEYNPIFLYGGVGLGKTHLLHAIANRMNTSNPNSKILYISSERFINEFIESLKADKSSTFRNKFRKLDCLLIDDIQFLISKEASREEFFYTFNALYDSKKQIVIASDKPPKELINIEERLLSRFEWGVIADIKPPDLETRIAILRKKAEGEKIYVPDDVILFLASQIKTNIRKLEGSLIRIVAFSTLTSAPLTVDTAKQILSDIIKREEEQQPIKIEKIQVVVAKFYHLDTKDMLSKKRTDEIALPRQIAMYIARSLTEQSTLQIGESFGGKDHTTVLHACNKIKNLINSDPFFAANINKIIQEIKTEE